MKHFSDDLHGVLYVNVIMTRLLLSRYTFENYERIYSFRILKQICFKVMFLPCTLKIKEVIAVESR